MKDMMCQLLQDYARHFPVDKGKYRVVNKVSGMFLGNAGRKVAALRYNNVKVNCDLSKHMQHELFYFGTYEEEDCKLWMRLCEKADVIFDVGANIGLYSLLASTTNPRASIHAFEPTPDLFNAFSGNVALNQLSNIRANQLAVGNVSGEAYLNYCTSSDGRNEGMNFVSAARPADAGEVTVITTIDDYCRQYHIASIDLMKMDIEGGEYNALKGAQNLLKRKAIKCILIELLEWAANRSGYSTKDIKALLLDHGYQLYKVKGGQRVKVSVEGVHDGDNVVAVPGNGLLF
jgi:FkbM family methyltransferase